MNNDAAQKQLLYAYELLRVNSPGELVRNFIAEDQKLLLAGEWDYKNPDLKVNKIKELIESAIKHGLNLGGEKQDDLRDILWFWYHHAIGNAIWGYKDKERAQEFSKKALEYQISDNPNKITRLLYLLVHDKAEEADTFLLTITTEPDKSAAVGVIAQFQDSSF
jgi:hypothetical protein